MAEDFGYCWRTVRLYCPSAPTFLAREWVQTAWKQLLAARRWGFLRVEYAFTTSADRMNPVVMPVDFGSFEVVVDKARQVRLSFTHSVADLGWLDPGGVGTGEPVALIAMTSQPYNPADPSQRGQVRYAPYPLGVAALTCIYNRQMPRLIDGQPFNGVLADGAEVLVAGALMQAAMWPGTSDKPNPYFNAALAQSKGLEFKHGIQMLSLRDDEQYPTDLWDHWTYADCGLHQSTDPRTTDACNC